MEFSHFIITQFNLRNFPLSDISNYESWIHWTRNRIELFNEYCLPSVINQSSKSFIWLLYFDTETPEEFNEFLNMLRVFPFINICYCKGIEDFNANYIREVKKRAGRFVKWIVTSRIDNDDCLHKDAIKTIQESFVKKHKFLISLASGYILNISDKKLSHYFYPMSPFISLIESSENVTGGVFERGHTKWDSLRLFIYREIWLEYFKKKSRESRFILKQPMWIQTVHGGNVSNNFYRGLPVIKERNLSDFAIKYKNNKQSIIIICKYYNYVIWKRYLKCLIIKYLIRK